MIDSLRESLSYLDDHLHRLADQADLSDGVAGLDAKAGADHLRRELAAMDSLGWPAAK